MLLLVLLLQAAPAPTQDAPAIVVTARPLKESERAWQECMARNCPPDQEIAAALAHAENLFVAGDYLKARTTLQKTIGHVDRHAKRYPTAVGDIWRADARIAAHMGESDAMRIGQFESVDALKAGLPQGDAQILVQRIEVADTFAKQGRFDVARMRYFRIAKEAEERNHPFVRGTALLRLAIMDNAFAEEEPTIYRERARESIERILATTEPQLAVFREAAELLQARRTAKDGDFSGIDALAAKHITKPTKRPMLLYTPAYNFENTRLDEDESLRSITPAFYQGQWADVTFLIGEDGRVREAELLRGAPTLKDWWIEPILKAVSSRRYAPLQVPAGLDGARRVERYTLTGKISAPTGTRINAQGGRPQIRMLDLTADAPTE